MGGHISAALSQLLSLISNPTRSLAEHRQVVLATLQLAEECSHQHCIVSLSNHRDRHQLQPAHLLYRLQLRALSLHDDVRCRYCDPLLCKRNVFLWPVISLTPKLHCSRIYAVAPCSVCQHAFIRSHSSIGKLSALVEDHAVCSPLLGSCWLLTHLVLATCTYWLDFVMMHFHLCAWWYHITMFLPISKAQGWPCHSPDLVVSHVSQTFVHLLQLFPIQCQTHQAPHLYPYFCPTLMSADDWPV